jgi:hypothetical protein
MMRKSIWLLLLFAMACTHKGVLLEQETFGKHWPLTVTECYVDCVGEFAVVVYANNTTYAINDAAKAMKQFENAEHITKNDSNYPGTKQKMSLSEIEFEGLKLCE